MRTLQILFLLFVAVSSFLIVCEGLPLKKVVLKIDEDISNDDFDGGLEAEDLDDLEAELDEAIYEDQQIDIEFTNKADSSQPMSPLKFPSFRKQGKINRRLNKKMALKIASILEESALLVANDLLQTFALLQTDPKDFLPSREIFTADSNKVTTIKKA